MTYSISIYQCSHNAVYCFREYDERKFSLDDYTLVYEGDFTPKYDGDDTQTLEEIFARFNCNDYPPEYKGRSLSVSDIVCVDGRYYYCEPIGWKRLDI